MNSVTICRRPAPAQGRAFYGNKSGASESHLEAALEPATPELYDIRAPFFKPYPDGGRAFSKSPPRPESLSAQPAIPGASSVVLTPGLNWGKNLSPAAETFSLVQKDSFRTSQSSCHGISAICRAISGYGCPPASFFRFRFSHFAPVPRPPNG